MCPRAWCRSGLRGSPAGVSGSGGHSGQPELVPIPEWGRHRPRASATATLCCCPLSGNARIVEKTVAGAPLAAATTQHLSARLVLARISSGRSVTRSSSTSGSLWSCSRLTRARLLELADSADGASLRFPLVILVLVKKARRFAPSAAPFGPPHPWQRRARKVVAGCAWADHSTVKVPPPRGTARYAPLPLRGARACRDSVPMLA